MMDSLHVIRILLDTWSEGRDTVSRGNAKGTWHSLKQRLERRACLQTDEKDIGNEGSSRAIADSIHEMDRLAAIAIQAGARNVGNRLEICYRRGK